MKKFLLYIVFSAAFTNSYGIDSLKAYFDQKTTFEVTEIFGRKVTLQLVKRKCETVSASSTLEKNESRYGAQNLIDNKTETAWAEGAQNGGTNETIEFEFEKLNEYNTGIPDIIEILPGYAKNQKTWSENNQLLSMRMTLLNEEKDEDNPVEVFHVQMATVNGKIPMKSQFINIRPYHIQNMAVDFFKYLKIEIIETKSGEKYNDLCISSINFYYAEQLTKN